MKPVTEAKRKRHGIAQNYSTSFGQLQNLNRELEIPPEAVLLKSSVYSKVKKFPATDQKIAFLSDMISKFNSGRAKEVWGADDLNLFVRALGTLFKGGEVGAYYNDIFCSPPPSTKAEAIVALIYAPILLAHQGEVPQILKDFGAYGIEEYKSTPPVVDLSLVFEADGEEGNEGDNNIEEERKIQEEKEKIQAEIDKLLRRKQELEARGSQIQTPLPSPPDFASLLLKTIQTFTEAAVAANSLQKKDGDEMDPAEIKEAKEKLKIFPEFRRMPASLQKKILTWEYFDIKLLMAHKDGRYDTPPKSKTIFEGVKLTVSSQDLDLEGQSFYFDALFQAFSTLAMYANVFDPHKVGMVLGLQNVLGEYNKAKYPVSKLYYFAEFIRKESAGKDANWTDPALLDRAYRLKLATFRDPAPTLTNFPFRSEFQTDSFYSGRRGFRGRGSFRSRGRGRGEDQAEAGDRQVSQHQSPPCRFFLQGVPCAYADAGRCKFSHKTE